MLTNSRACVVQSSTLLFAVDAVFAIYMGSRTPPPKHSDAWLSFIWRLVPYRHILEEPPFFFKEVRLSMLTFSLLYGVGRLMYEAIIGDVFVVLVAARLCVTAYMLRDQWWLCRNWKTFFMEHTLRPWLWQRAFIATGWTYLAFSLNAINDFEWVKCASFIVVGLLFGVWYMWGKRWDWHRNDMDDDRRVRAVAYVSVNVSAVFFARMLYDLGVNNGYFSSSLIISVAWFIVGAVIYAVDRRQQRSKAAITQRQTTLNTLTGSAKHGRVASGLDDEKCDDVDDADDAGNDRGLSMTVTPFVCTESPTVDAGYSSTPPAVSAGGGNNDLESASVPAHALAATADDSNAKGAQDASAVEVPRQRSFLQNLSRRLSLLEHTTKLKIDTVVSDRMIAVVYQVRTTTNTLKGCGLSLLPPRSS